MKKTKSLKFESEFKALPDSFKPREKLAKFGPQSLQLWELVALLLRTGERHKGGYFEDVAQLSKRLVAEAGFKGLFHQKSSPDLQENYEIYKSHAETLVTVSEICRRLHGSFDTFDVSEPHKVFNRFKGLKKAKQEHCYVLHVDQQNVCTYQELTALGTQDEVQVFPSDILRSAIWLGVKKIIIVHNHPNETAKPSEADVSWTLKIKQGAWDLHQIKVQDHVIIGRDDYFSFLEAGLV